MASIYLLTNTYKRTELSKFDYVPSKKKNDYNIYFLEEESLLLS